MYRTHSVIVVARWLGRSFLLALLLTPVSAWAYLDPTTGSMVISAIVGLIASLVLGVRTYWYKLKALFKRTPVTVDPDDKTG